MKTVTRVPARYVRTGVRRFDGHPYIEALPPLPETKQALLLQLSNYPDPPTGKVRQASDIVRIMELSTLSDVVYPFPDYGESALDLTKIIRESYVARNPLNAIDIQRRHALASNSADGLPFPSDWKSSAEGHIMVAITGMGKSTFWNAFSLRYPQVIDHTAYGDHPLAAVQIVYIVLSVPHDATLKGLCVQFFEEIDRILGKTEYSKVARSVRTIALMVQLMHTVATTVSLGLIVIDDVQNLSAAQGPTAEFLLNLFSQIVERLGISLFLISTPAIDKVLINIVRNTRKSASSGCVPMLPMARNSALWKDFSETYWDYTFVKKKKRLTDSIRNAWWDASAGDTAFAVLAFMLTQQNAIGGTVEEVNEQGFQRTMATNMAILQPAIASLRCGRISTLKRFDDLLFGKEYWDLMRRIKTEPAAESSVKEDFDEVTEAVKESQQSQTSKNGKQALTKDPDFNFPVEDPLRRYE
ncbi:MULTISPECIES: ATP-binding protein [Paraburkholderia]|uniref:ATP-binding protein n=1 Tax=Paraburkholderia TaxID=1822464 RepID=UPI00224C9D69|nr:MULTISPECIES: ATP-binding protein [Paraburkholderia]MCX4173719.1 ATP-binding protein [Paraburkholderia madseniana]MDQ6461724.1 ATP-binding protein [Paraburkholderia madseniana]